MNNTIGKHVTVDFEVFEEFNDTLMSVDKLRADIESVIAGKVNILDTGSYDFGEGLGVTIFWLLAESHISIHTYPEHKYAALDIFTCGEAIDPVDLVGPLMRTLGACYYKISSMKRGLNSP